jgi:hypothetical protein
MAVDIYNPSTQAAEAEGSRVQNHTSLYSKFRVYIVRPCLTKNMTIVTMIIRF